MNHNILVDITNAGELMLNGESIPGIFQAMEVSGDLRIDKVNRPGRSGSAKLAEGWEDMKLLVRLVLPPDEPGGYPGAAARKLAELFQRADKNVRPFVYTIAHPIAAALNLTDVLFKTLRVTATSEGDFGSAELEFLEFRPVVVRREKMAKNGWSFKPGELIGGGLAAAPQAAKAAAEKIGGGIKGAADAAQWLTNAVAGKLAPADTLYGTLPKGSGFTSLEADVFQVVP